MFTDRQTPPPLSKLARATLPLRRPGFHPPDADRSGFDRPVDYPAPRLPCPPHFLDHLQERLVGAKFVSDLMKPTRVRRRRSREDFQFERGNALAKAHGLHALHLFYPGPAAHLRGPIQTGDYCRLSAARIKKMLSLNFPVFRSDFPDLKICDRSVTINW